MTDSKDRTADIRDALREAGISEAALPTAAAEFRPEYAGAGYNPEGDWTLGGSTTTLRKHARRYVEAHPFLRGPSEEQAPPPSDKWWPRYADGSRVPGDKVSVGELADTVARDDAEKAAELRGPEPDTSLADAERHKAAREALQRESEEAAKMASHTTSMRVEPLRGWYGDTGPTLDELAEAAGPFPNKR